MFNFLDAIALDVREVVIGTWFQNLPLQCPFFLPHNFNGRDRDRTLGSIRRTEPCPYSYIISVALFHAVVSHWL